MTSTATAPLHVLVTAGPTREMIDAVRDWGNIFTGQTGLDLALAFLELGPVTLLTSNAEHARQYDGYSAGRGMLGVETFRAHGDLEQLLAERMTSGDRVDVAAMTAAVADYAPAGTYRIVSRGAAESGHGRDADATGGAAETWVVEPVGLAPGQGKVKSTLDEIAILGRRTPKLIDRFRRDWNFRGLLVKFKLEVGLTDEELLRVAGASRRASGADLMVANTLAMARPTGGGAGGAYLLDENGVQRVSRNELAAAVIGWVKART
jgi:phosphopantothenate---cysteine ligase (CTP)